MKNVVLASLLVCLSLPAAECPEGEVYIPALGMCVVEGGGDSLPHLDFPEGVDHQLYRNMVNNEYDISGYFSTYDFNHDGMIEKEDWLFVAQNGSTFQLLGDNPNEMNVFGWKPVDVATPPSPMFAMIYLGDWDGDDDARFDWLIINMANNAVYKLVGASEDHTFQYSNRIPVELTRGNDKIIFEKGILPSDGNNSDFPE